MPILRTLSDSVVALIVIGFLAWSNPLALTLMVSVLGSAVFIYDRFFRRRLGRMGAIANDAATKILQGVHEGIEGFKELRILGKEKYFHAMVHKGARDHASQFSRIYVISTAPRYLLELLMVIFVVLLVTITFRLGGNPATLVPMLALFGAAALRLLPMINLFAINLVQLRFNRDAVSRLYEDLKEAEEIAVGTAAEIPSTSRPPPSTV